MGFMLFGVYYSCGMDLYSHGEYCYQYMEHSMRRENIIDVIMYDSVMITDIWVISCLP